MSVRTPGMYILVVFKHECVHKCQRMRHFRFFMLRTSAVSQWYVLSISVITDIGCNTQMCFVNGELLGNSVDDTIFDTTVLQFTHLSTSAAFFGLSSPFTLK